MEHYVVIWDYVLDDMEGDTGVLGVAHTFEEAKEVFDQNVESEKEYAKESNWTVYDDNDACFDAGEEGRWCANHTRLWIQKVM